MGLFDEQYKFDFAKVAVIKPGSGFESMFFDKSMIRPAPLRHLGRIFDGLTFDVSAFALAPKCVGVFVDDSGAGCLLTAFWKAFGFKPVVATGRDLWARKEGGHAERLTGFVPPNPFLCDLANADFMRDHTDALAAFLIPRDADQHIPSDQFCQAIIKRYDEGREPEALKLLWELIDRLPNKKGFAKVEEVVMPSKQTCAV